MTEEDAGGEVGLIGTSYNLKSGADTLAHYEVWAETYGEEVNEDLGYAQPTRCAAALAAVVQRADGKTGGRLLDVGCGTGLSGLALRDAGFTNQDGCDFSQPMLDRAAATGVYRRLFEADLNEGLEVDDGLYDCAAAVGVFSFGHLEPPVLREVLRVVRLGGAVVVGLNDHFWDLGTFPAELNAIETDGIARVTFQEHGDLLPGADISGWVVVLVRTVD